MPSSELVDVAMKVLRAHVVMGAVSALQQGPERFNAVGVDLATDELANPMLDRCMGEPLEVLIGVVLVGVDGGAIPNVGRDACAYPCS